jgi:hypothetical protein
VAAAAASARAGVPVRFRMRTINHQNPPNPVATTAVREAALVRN